MRSHHTSPAPFAARYLALPDGTIDGGGNRSRGNAGGDCTGVICR